MDYTTNIFVNETNYKGNSNRADLGKKLKLEEKPDSSKPLLAVIVEALMSGAAIGSGTGHSNDNKVSLNIESDPTVEAPAIDTFDAPEAVQPSRETQQMQQNIRETQEKSQSKLLTLKSQRQQEELKAPAIEKDLNLEEEPNQIIASNTSNKRHR